jgi:uncharacterized protein
MSAIEHIRGSTWHGRKGDLKNAFRYSIDYLCLDIENAPPKKGIFKRDSGWLFGLYGSDHGGPVGDGRGAAWVRDVAAGYNIKLPGKILLLAQPRIFGHVFNPVSFWLCYDAQDRLFLVIAEVTNTFGDRHSYLCKHTDLRPIQPSDRLKADKIFHVSPFQPIQGAYEFRFDIRPEKIGIWIDLQMPQGGVMATLTGPRRALSNFSILGALLRRPFGSRRVLGLIHLQALRLWWKGAKYRPRPTPPKAEIS